jgi:hypothetical protein
VSLCFHRVFHQHHLIGPPSHFSKRLGTGSEQGRSTPGPLPLGPFVGDLTDTAPNSQYCNSSAPRQSLRWNIAASDTRSDVHSVETSGFGRSIYPNPRAEKSLAIAPTPRFVLNGLLTFCADPMVDQRDASGGQSVSSHRQIHSSSAIVGPDTP